LHFKTSPAVVEGYCDANWVFANTKINTNIGYVFTLASVAIYWKLSKQTCIAKSIIKYEFIALKLADHGAEWLRSLLQDILLSRKPTPSVFMHCDSEKP